MTDLLRFAYPKEACSRITASETQTSSILNMISEFNILEGNEYVEIPLSWQRVKIEVEYLDPAQVNSQEINVVAFGESLALLTKSESGIIPKYPNPRGLNTTHKIFLGLMDTLRETPELYLVKNRGAKISAYVEDIKDTDRGTSVLILAFAPPSADTIGQGVHDGQHTLFSFVRASLDGINLSQAKARLLILNRYLPTFSEGEISTDWQKNKKLPPSTIFNAQGKFNVLQDAIPTDWKVAYYQDQPDVSKDPKCKIDHLVQLLAVLDFEKYDWQNPRFQVHPTYAVFEVGHKFNRAYDSACKLIHLVEDALSIEACLLKYIKNEQIRIGGTMPGFSFPIPGQEHLFKGSTMLPNGQVFQMTASSVAILPIVSAFRIGLEREKGLIDWKFNLKKYEYNLIARLWKQAKLSMSERVAYGAKSETWKILALDPRYWHALCAEVNKFCKEKESEIRQRKRSITEGQLELIQ